MTAISLSIKHNWPDVERQLARLQKDIGDKAVVRALNATIKQGETAMARQISLTYRISQSVVKQRLSVTRARRNGGRLELQVTLEATRKGRGRSMNMIAFVTTAARRLKTGKRNQTKLQVRRDGGRKQVTGAFIGNQERTLFIRTGKARLPIEPVNTIDVVQMFNTRKISAAVQTVLLDRFAINFTRELKVVLGGFAR
jgi:hypothetical protein